MDPTIPPPGLIEWLQALFWFVALLLVLVALAKLIRGKAPQPPNQQLEQAHNGLQQSFDQHVGWDQQEHRDLRRDLQQARETEDKAASERRAAIYSKLDATRIELAREIGAVRSHVDERLDGLHERVTNLALEFTKGIATLRGEMKARNTEKP